MSSVGTKLSHMAVLPVEILLEIYRHLDLDSIFHLASTNHSFLSIFQQRKALILLPALHQDFCPFDELLQVYTASSEDLHACGGLYRPRKVVFRRCPDDSGHAISPHVAEPLSAEPTNGFVKITKGGKAESSNVPNSRTVVLTDQDFGPILQLCKLVSQWESLFPQMRWFHEPENCRSLRPEESVRYRRAFYRWWLYGIYFHGELPRPRVGLPAPYNDDVRTSQMRYYSTTELLELMDLVETMKDVVLHYICPRLDTTQHHSLEMAPLVDHHSRGYSLANGWVDSSPWGRIVKTYAKLGPRELMYYFDNIYSFPRKRLITDVHLQLSNFTFDQESIQVAIRCALDERQWLARAPSLAEDSVGGIIDFDDERDKERVEFGGDASPNGCLPPGHSYIRSFSQYSPRGDDGAGMDDPQRMPSFGARFAVSNTLEASLV